MPPYKRYSQGASSNGSPPLSPEILSEIQKTFPNHLPSSLKIKKLGNAMTNEVFLCSLSRQDGRPDPHPFLLRLYGRNTSLFFNREEELSTFKKLSSKHFGPRLLGSFEGGRIEEFIEGEPLRKEEMRDPEISRRIGGEMARLHALFPQGREEDCLIWGTLRRYLDRAKMALEGLKGEGRGGELMGIDLGEIGGEMREMESRGLRVGGRQIPVVFCHNDVQHGNIIKRKTDGSLVFIDYEYAGYNYRGFDIANHFWEWTANYESSEPHILDFSLFPSRQQQISFLEGYLSPNFGEGKGKKEREKSKEEKSLELEGLLEEIRRCSLLSHLKWGLWGIIQERSSRISFNYAKYAAQRLEEYQRGKGLYL